MFMNALYANVLLHRFAKLYGLGYRIRKKEMLIHFLFPYSQFFTVEIRKPITLCLEVKMIMNALYVNVPNLFVSKVMSNRLILNRGRKWTLTDMTLYKSSN